MTRADYLNEWRQFCRATDREQAAWMRDWAQTVAETPDFTVATEKAGVADKAAPAGEPRCAP
jgi:hypothetical protein